jgi:hypothetical protein
MRKRLPKGLRKANHVGPGSAKLGEGQGWVPRRMFIGEVWKFPSSPLLAKDLLISKTSLASPDPDDCLIHVFNEGS